MLADKAKHALQLRVAQKRGRAAAEMKLGKFVPAVQMRGEQRHFFFQIG